MGTQKCLTAQHLKSLLAATKHSTDTSVPGTNISYAHKSLNSICTKMHFKRLTEPDASFDVKKTTPIPQRDISLLISFEAHVSGSCFWSKALRFCFTMSAISFLKTGKELYLLSAGIKLACAFRRLMTHVQVPFPSERIHIQIQSRQHSPPQT